MLLDAREVPSGASLSCDVCIIGAGAAGITLARELKNHADVIVVESGALEFDRDVHDLYGGSVAGDIWREVAGPDNAGDQYLQICRQRFFGGSTNCWAGFSRPLDESVFLQRAWVPDSGWPIKRADLDSYYNRAARLCDIEDQYSEDGAINGRSFPEGVALEPAIEYRSPPTRFGFKYRAELTAAERVKIYLNGSVTDVVANRTGDRIDRIEVRTLEAKPFQVESGVFILATGGIENPRILLSANGVHKRGLGNANDLVGRYFMEHLYPEVVPGIAALTRTDWKGMPEYDEFGIWTLGRETTARHGLLNVGVAFEKFGERPGKFTRSVLAAAKTLDRHGEALQTSTQSMLTKVRLHVELSPHKDNRVSLSDEVDALGMPRVRLHWNLTKLDRYSMEKSLELYIAELGRGAAGRVSSGGFEMRGAFGCHQLGTTRMSEDPRTGVVDANCLVHGLSNLYIAGSSVFPTGGFENPTFTILALALRLADHLRAT